MEADGPKRQTVEQLAEEFVERFRRGERPPLSEYIGRDPEHADEIRDLFPALVMMEQIAPDSEGRSLARWPTSLRGRRIEHPERLGDYRILSEIGRGGMGVVYEAEQVSLGRHVALKVLPQQFLFDTRQQKRFEREAKAAARLHHTNIVPVFGIGEENGLHYYVMQFIAGLGLDQILDELKRLRPGRGGTPTPGTHDGRLQVSPRHASAAKVAQSLLTGVFRQPDGGDEAEADGQAIPGDAPKVDVQPLLEDLTLGFGQAPAPVGGRPASSTGRLSDSYVLSASFEALPGQSATGGPARLPTYWQSVAHIGAQVAAGLEYAHQQGVLHRDIKPANLLLDLHGNVWITDFGLAKSAGQENLTATGDVVGTLRYMAPEAFNGQHDARSEVCALGLALYELLALQPAFDETDRQRLIRQVSTAEPPRLDRTNRAIPRDLGTIVHKAIDRNPARRYQTAAELGEDLGRFLRDEPVLARRVSGPERLVRWTRQHTGMASALAMIGFLLVGTAVASTLAAWKFQHLAGDRKAALGAAIGARNEANDARDVERWERYRSNIAAASAALQLQNTDSARPALEAAPVVHRDWEWRHLHSQLDVASLVMTVPGGPVIEMSLSPSGRQVAVACLDHSEAYLFDIATAKPEGVLRGHTAPVSFLAYSPDGTRLATGAGDGTIRLWDPATGREVAILRGSPGAVRLSFSPDGRRIVARSGEEVQLWDALTGQRVASLGHHEFPETDLHRLPQFRAGNRRVISGRMNEVCQWDAATGTLIGILGRFDTNVDLLACSPDGKRVVAAARDDPNIRIWDSEARRDEAVLLGHISSIYRLHFSPNGSRLLTASSYPDVTPRLWDAATGRLVVVLSGHTNSLTDEDFSPDGRVIGTASMDRTARLWDSRTGKLIAVLRGHTAKLWCVRFSPDGRRVVTAAEDATLRLWDARTGELTAVLRGHGGHGKNGLTAPFFTPDGLQLVSASPDGTIRVWDLGMIERHGVFRGHESFVYDVAMSPDGQQVASAAWDGMVRVWDMNSGQQEALLRHEASILFSVTYRHDGRQLVTTARGQGVTLWDRITGKWQLVWRMAEDVAENVDARAVFNPQGTLVAAGSNSGSVRLMDTMSGKLVAVLEAHKDRVVDVAFRPDGAQFASASFDRTIRLWDTVTRDTMAILRGHTDGITRIAYSADGTLLASCSLDMTVRFWDVSTYRELAVVPMGSHVFGVAFSPDGARLAAACSDGTIRLLDVARRQQVAELRGHSDYVHAVAWSPDGTRLVSGSGDFTVRIWDSLPDQERARTRQARDPAR